MSSTIKEDRHNSRYRNDSTNNNGNCVNNFRLHHHITNPTSDLCDDNGNPSAHIRITENPLPAANAAVVSPAGGGGGY